MRTIKTCAFVLVLIYCVNISSIESLDVVEFRSKSDQGIQCEWEGKNGTCVDFWQCFTNAIDAVKGKHPPVCSIEGGKVYSCCTGCDLVANISSIVILDQFGFLFTKTGKKSKDSANRSADCVRNLYENAEISHSKSWSWPHDLAFLGNLDDNFAYTEKSAIDTSMKVITGRPHGGVAILSRKTLFASVSIVKCESDRLVAIKVVYENRPMLLFSAYMPFDDNKSDSLVAFTQCTSEIVAVIEKCLDYMRLYTYPCYAYLHPGNVKKIYRISSKCFGWVQERWAAAGGEDAERSEFPHMALLGYGEEQESAAWLCGGTIISERYILTAGHCRSSTQLGQVQFIALGILKRSDPPSLWQVYRVDTFIPHPEYRPPSKYHDIALIRTDTQIRLGGAVLPACLAQGDEKMDIGDATGWGALGHRKGTADVLQKVGVKAFNSDQCSEQYLPHRHLAAGYNHTTQMCYGDPDLGKDTCEGDSGGPLQLDECPHKVFGVTSSGHPCGFAGGAGLYTRVAFYVSWIESIVWP